MRGAMKLDRVIRTKLLGQPYRPSQRRFEEDKARNLQSASVVISFLLDVLPIRSVIDVGCGAGFWLKAFADRGVEKVVGVDGDYTDRSRLAIDRSDFIGRDLNQPLSDLGLG